MLEPTCNIAHVIHFQCRVMYISPHAYLQATDEVYGFKHGRAVCICVEGSTGVVCYDQKSISCATCRYGTTSCKHVNRVLDLIQEQPPPIALKNWVMSEVESVKQSQHIFCKSRAPIPFMYLPSQQEILRQPMVVRLNIQNGIAHLCPWSSSRCSICGGENWSDPLLIRESKVVMETCIIPAKGIVQYSISYSLLQNCGVRSYMPVCYMHAHVCRTGIDRF